jgi:hypothetical protein
VNSSLIKLSLICFSLTIALAGLTRLDRYFFKQNDSFCLHFIQSDLPYHPEWEVASPPEALLERIFDQKFTYLAKGGQSYAFVSEDQNYVIKFYRFPSHLRLFPRLNHPLGYSFSSKRIKIKEHNLQKLQTAFQSFKTGYEKLQEETGLIYAHLNHTDHLERNVEIVDRLGRAYSLPLDKTCFLLQERGDLIYPTLNALLQKNEVDGAKAVITQLIQLIASCCQKGYIDTDPVLRKNYGIASGRAIHLDVGDFVYCEEVKDPSHTADHVIEMTASLKKRLQSEYPQLLSHYEQEIDRLLR